MLKALKTVYAPTKVMLLRDEKTKESLIEIAPFVAGQLMKSGQATAYVCVDHACSLPTNNPNEMLDIIKEKLSSSATPTRDDDSGETDRAQLR